MSVSSQQITHQIKHQIVASSIADDKKRIATQWLNTFRYQQPATVSTEIMKMLLACVAQGDFKLRSEMLDSPELHAPNPKLKNVDYLSHASRIILDYQELSDENQQKLLALFPDPSNNPQVIARSATHGVVRTEDNITELKGFILGVKGQIPGWLRTVSDFGCNIAMGGVNQKNYVGKRITNNGFSGHVYFHHNKPDKLLMVGLEQSAPAGSIYEAFIGHTEEIESEEQVEAQKLTDQFQQSHSLAGKSDVFTAAGSQYFSDPVYIAKLLAEDGCPPPDKYNGMHVRLTDENWPQVLAFYQEINAQITSEDLETVKEMLLSSPKSSDDFDSELLIKSFVAIDFKTYLKRIAQLLPSDLNSSSEERLESCTQNLLQMIHQLHSGDHSIYEAFLALIDEITAIEGVNDDYQTAINRIKILFQKQLEIDPELKNTHEELAIKNRHIQLEEQAKSIESKLQKLTHFYRAEQIAIDEDVRAI